MNTSSTKASPSWNYPIEQRQAYLADLLHECVDCEKCKLSTARQNVVVPRTLFTGEVNLGAAIMIVGGAPSYASDESGLSFTGETGKVFEDAIYELGLEEEVYYTNTLKCKPEIAGGPAERKACWPYLQAEIRIIRPLLIVGSGTAACNALLGTESLSMRALVNEGPFRYTDTDRNIDTPLFPMYSPSYLLGLKKKGGEKYTQFKDEYWLRFQEMRAQYDLLTS